MKKKYIYLSISVVMLFIGIGIGIVGTNILAKQDDKKEEKQEEPAIKGSRYTLDELYAIVEDPERYYKENGSTINYYALTMYNFYDYFSKSTPVKIATKVERDKDFKVTKVLETDYISYDVFMERTSGWREADQMLRDNATEEERKEFEESGFNYYFNYRHPVDLLIYGWADYTMVE